MLHEWTESHAANSDDVSDAISLFMVVHFYIHACLLIDLTKETSSVNAGGEPTKRNSKLVNL